MTIGTATALRIKKLLKERNMTPYRLEQRSGVLHGTMSSILNEENNDIRFGTIIKIAKGFDMTFMEFLDDPLFHSDELEYEY